MKKRNRIGLIILISGFILFRLPISILLIELFSLTQGSIEVGQEVLRNNVVMSKFILNSIVFGVLMINVESVIFQKMKPTKRNDSIFPTIMISMFLVLPYIIWDAVQTYHILTP